MKTLRDVRRVAKKFNATIVDDKIGDTHECTAEAPQGHVWKADGIHMFVDCAYRPWKPDYADLIDRMEHGIEKCEDPDCDWCHPVES